jgi:expansin (peptidoglycan-binding protein)
MNTKAWVACLCFVLLACDGVGARDDASTGTVTPTATATDTVSATVTISQTTTATTTATTTGTPTNTATTLYGSAFSGQYHLGPVDFAETEWHNACAPEGGYVSSLREATGLSGEFLAGVQTGKIAGGANCDACIFIKTATGKAIVARVVTYGDTGANDLDVSPSVYAALNTGEYPRTTTWQWAKCPDTGKLSYEFQTGANVWWTSLWVRNPRVPITKVEVKSKNHANYITLARASDGTVTDASGFGEGAFTLRVTASDGQTITDSFSSFTPGKILASTQQFQ